MASQPSSRRRFQFRLRTLMIVVTLLAVPCAYVGWQKKIVLDRKAVADLVNQRGGVIMWASPFEKHFSPPGFQVAPAEVPGEAIIQMPYPKASQLRQWLGDDYALYILCSSSSLSEEEVVRVKRAFPEAYIQLCTDTPTGAMTARPSR
jgi:hypothetical protein